MIVNRGATQAALERWNERRRRIFYPKTDVDFDLDALRKRKAELSEIDLSAVAKILDEEVRAIEFIPNAGTFHALFRVRTSGKNWVLKLSAEEIAPGFLIEDEAMRLLKKRGLPSLQIADYERVSQKLPSPFLLIEEARGQSVSMLENSQTQSLAEPILFEFGRLLAEVHQTKAYDAGLFDVLEHDWVGVLPTWNDYLRIRLTEHLEVCLEIGAINSAEQSRIEKWFSDLPLAAISMRVLHGDPGHHNVFSDGQTITAIIDWEDALAGDPIFDIAYWGTFVRDEMRARFLEGYQTVEKLPADFEYRYWLYYLRIALSKTVHRHRFGTKDGPGRPAASLRIQKALSKLAEL